MSNVSPLKVRRDFVPHLCAKTYYAWEAVTAAAFGELLTLKQRALFEECTGRKLPPAERVKELWLICGRGAGKSEEIAFLAVYLSCFVTYTPSLGEDLVGMLLAADRKQARVVMRYVKEMLHSHPVLESMILRRGAAFVETASSITLRNGLRIEVHTSNFRSVRGYTIPFVICDEIAFWKDENSANPDEEVLKALRPGMGRASLGPQGGMLLCLSSPYAQQGALFKAFQKHYGKERDRILVWKAPTRTMNPTYSQDQIDLAYESDPIAADCEYGANFHTDVQALFDPDTITACTSVDAEHLPEPGITYRGFVDPSGGKQDSMTLAIAHSADGIEVLDVLREEPPPFSPDDVTGRFAELLKTYRLNSVTGDRYGGEWPRERFRVHGIDYLLADKNKSELYRDLLPLVNSKRVVLLEHKRLASQLGTLERRTGRGGRDSIDHRPGAHDDIANAAAGALVTGGAGPQYRIRTFGNTLVQVAASLIEEKPSIVEKAA